MVGMAVEAGAMEDGAVGATTGTATMVAQGIEADPWLAGRLVADSAGASRQEALHAVAFTAAVGSMAAVASTEAAASTAAADTGRLHP